MGAAWENFYEEVLFMQVLSRMKMEIRPNFGGGSPGFIRGGVSFFLQGGVPDFPKQGGLYPSDPPRCTPMQ